MSFHPFQNDEEVERIKKERDELLDMLNNYNMSDSEKRFIIKRIENITKKLLEKAKYSK
jgi:hypothetical protein